jgi:transcriptional regulator with XRE-family HTH domain
MDMDASALAGRIGITYQQLQKYEKGMNRISAARLYAIAKALDVPIEYFYRDASADGVEVDADAQQRSEQFSLLTSTGADILKQYLTIPKPEIRKALLALMRSIAEDPRPKS